MADTGFPTPPQGTIWRVSEEPAGGYSEYGHFPAMIIVQLVAPNQEYVKRRFLRPSVTLKKDIVLGYERVIKSHLQDAANVPVKLFDMALEILKRREAKDKIADLLGDYPPKKLPLY